jgi:hypothetical protein
MQTRKMWSAECLSRDLPAKFRPVLEIREPWLIRHYKARVYQGELSNFKGPGFSCYFHRFDLVQRNPIMSKHSVLLLGATGETGGDVLRGLIEDGTFVSIPSSIYLKIIP